MLIKNKDILFKWLKENYSNKEINFFIINSTLLNIFDIKVNTIKDINNYKNVLKNSSNEIDFIIIYFYFFNKFSKNDLNYKHYLQFIIYLKTKDINIDIFNLNTYKIDVISLYNNKISLKLILNFIKNPYEKIKIINEFDYELKELIQDKYDKIKKIKNLNYEELVNFFKNIFENKKLEIYNEKFIEIETMINNYLIEKLNIDIKLIKIKITKVFYLLNSILFYNKILKIKNIIENKKLEEEEEEKKEEKEVKEEEKIIKSKNIIDPNTIVNNNIINEYNEFKNKLSLKENKDFIDEIIDNISKVKLNSTENGFKKKNIYNNIIEEYNEFKNKLKLKENKEFIDDVINNSLKNKNNNKSNNNIIEEYNEFKNKLNLKENKEFIDEVINNSLKNKNNNKLYNNIIEEYNEFKNKLNLKENKEFIDDVINNSFKTNKNNSIIEEYNEFKNKLKLKENKEFIDDLINNSLKNKINNKSNNNIIEEYNEFKNKLNLKENKEFIDDVINNSLKNKNNKNNNNYNNDIIENKNKKDIDIINTKNKIKLNNNIGWNSNKNSDKFSIILKINNKENPIIKEYLNFYKNLKLKENKKFISNIINKLNNDINVNNNLNYIFEIYTKKQKNNNEKNFQDIEKHFKFMYLGEFIMICNDFGFKTNKQDFHKFVKYFKHISNKLSFIDYNNFFKLMNLISYKYYKINIYLTNKERYDYFCNYFKLYNKDHVNIICNKNQKSFKILNNTKLLNDKQKREAEDWKLYEINQKKKFLNLKNSKHNPLEYLYKIKNPISNRVNPKISKKPKYKIQAKVNNINWDNIDSISIQNIQKVVKDKDIKINSKNNKRIAKSPDLKRNLLKYGQINNSLSYSKTNHINKRKIEIQKYSKLKNKKIINLLK